METKDNRQMLLDTHIRAYNSKYVIWKFKSYLPHHYETSSVGLVVHRVQKVELRHPTK
jgi:hypothetical protein